MRSKAPLALMEQLIMVLVFALAAALCLQMFALSDRISREKEAQDRLVILVQNAAELVKHTGGDSGEPLAALQAQFGGQVDGPVWHAFFDEMLTPTLSEQAAYRVEVRLLSADSAGLNRAQVVAARADGTVPFPIDLFWQKEVTAHG